MGRLKRGHRNCRVEGKNISPLWSYFTRKTPRFSPWTLVCELKTLIFSMDVGEGEYNHQGIRAILRKMYSKLEKKVKSLQGTNHLCIRI